MMEKVWYEVDTVMLMTAQKKKAWGCYTRAETIELAREAAAKGKKEFRIVKVTETREIVEEA
jgi:hypothetical protein